MTYMASMTTYPLRFKSALCAIESISNQTVMPNALVINIANEDWDSAEKEFVKNARDKFNGELIFQKCKNLKPANKIIPTAQEYTDEIIITFDDDILYPKDRAERLLKKHEEYPNNPIAYRTRYVTFSHKKVRPYSDWPISYGDNVPDKLHFATAVSGNLYPPNFFSDDFFSIDKYIKLSHNSDDIWTYFHVLLKGSAFVKVGTEVVPPGVPGSQEGALWKTNVSLGGNDIIIKLLEKEYGSLYDLVGGRND